MSKLKIIYMGTPDFAVPALRALHEDRQCILCVYTQPPRKAGRGHKVMPSPVHTYAEHLGIPVKTPSRLKNNSEELSFISSLKPDVIVVAAYGLLLPKVFLDIPAKGCLNIHASLLPRWRGASPIQSAILAGDLVSGVSIMQMDEGLDTGPVLLQGKTPIDKETTAQTLHDQLSSLGAELILKTLHTWPVVPVPQPTSGVTYAPRLTKQDGTIDWSLSAEHIDRQIRAFTPWPGTFTSLNGETLKIGSAKPIAIPPYSNPEDKPGTLLNHPLIIRCGQHTALQITSLQRSGGKMLETERFLLGYPIPLPAVFGT